MRPLPPDLAAEVTALLAAWERTWQTPDLSRRIAVEISPRLRRSAGRCLPERGLVRLAPRVIEGDREALHEVLCHEAAHVAVHLRHGRAARAHGPEWRALVTAAGYPARTGRTARATSSDGDSGRPRHLRWEHRCPVCQSVRLAARPVPRWRCRACTEAGLDGRLEVRRIDDAARDHP